MSQGTGDHESFGAASPDDTPPEWQRPAHASGVDEVEPAPAAADSVAADDRTGPAPWSPAEPQPYAEAQPYQPTEQYPSSEPPQYAQPYPSADPAPYDPRAQYPPAEQYAPAEPAPYEPRAQYPPAEQYAPAEQPQQPYAQSQYQPAVPQQYPIPPAAQQAAPQQVQPQPPQPQPPAPQHQQPGPSYPSDQQPAYAPAPPQPAPIPRPEDLLAPNQVPATAAPASWGWRGRVNRASGGLIKPKAAQPEIAVRQAITGIQRSFSRPMTVVVIQPKGGAGKTPATICLSAAFGAHRGGYVVGWDDNETRGTLAVRVANPDGQRATVWDLLGDLAAFERFDARVGDLSHYVRSQPDAHFDALVSDDNPGNMAQIGEDEFHRLHKVLQRFYRMIVVDTGNNVRSPNWQAAVNAADLIVVVSTYQRDVGYSGSWVLDHLAQTGREELARNAVTILSAADPTTDKTVRDQLVSHFQARTRAVAEIPYDTELAHGGPIRWGDLAAPTRNAWILAGATIVDSLVELDQQALATRRT